MLIWLTRGNHLTARYWMRRCSTPLLPRFWEDLRRRFDALRQNRRIQTQPMCMRSSRLLSVVGTTNLEINPACNVELNKRDGCCFQVAEQVRSVGFLLWHQQNWVICSGAWRLRFLVFGGRAEPGMALPILAIGRSSVAASGRCLSRPGVVCPGWWTPKGHRG